MENKKGFNKGVDDHNSAVMESLAYEVNDSLNIKDACHNDPQRTGFVDVPLKEKEQTAFKLMDINEDLLVTSFKDFEEKLGCVGENKLKVKVVSVFGNTGEGKSHLLNQIFFNKKSVFKTSSMQTSCTMGIWAALCKEYKLLILDSEGMMGASGNPKQRKRMLLKVLAISDIIIYRTRAERLHNDLFQFLSEASTAYTKYFKGDLENISKKMKLPTLLGPSLFIFHDTRNTEVLCRNEQGQSAEEQIRERFSLLNYKADAFSSINYVGENCFSTDVDFSRISEKILEEKNCDNVRAPRLLKIILEMLKVLNNKFNGQIIHKETMFPDEYFTCTSYCDACNARCSLFMNHKLQDDQSEHQTDGQCCYKVQYDNKIYLCLKCDSIGRRSVVIPQTVSSQESSLLGLARYAWSGYTLECDQCGVIYRSKEYWFGNKEPDQVGVVKTEHVHKWPGTVVGSSPNAGQQILDTMNVLGSSMSNLTGSSTKAISHWFSDTVNPAYWKPNNECENCDKCNVKLSTIHHCRRCGLAFCEDCSLNTDLVPERGWGDQLVRVCDICVKKDQPTPDQESEVHSVAARQVSEVFQGTIVSSAKYTLDIIKSSARPTYWVPDDQIKNCIVCNDLFGEKLSLHHCRACGEGVCDPCSENLMVVKERGWNTEVRVCNLCYHKRYNKVF